MKQAKIPSYILAVDTDGLSVLTAYSDGKFEADKIAGVMKKLGLEEKVNHRNIVIPGMVAVLSGKLEEKYQLECYCGTEGSICHSRLCQDSFCLEVIECQNSRLPFSRKTSQ